MDGKCGPIYQWQALQRLSDVPYPNKTNSDYCLSGGGVIGCEGTTINSTHIMTRIGAIPVYGSAQRVSLTVNSLNPVGCNSNFKIIVFEMKYKIVARTLKEKLVLGEYHITSLMRSQHCFRYFRDSMRYHAITWANVDPEIWRHVTLLGHNALMMIMVANCHQCTQWPAILQTASINVFIWISNKTSLRYVTWCQMDNIPSLVQIMGCRRTGDKPLSEPMMA